MALDIIKQYITLLSEFFTFSEAMTSPSLGSSPTPPMLPKHSNTLTTMHHLTKILGEIQETVNEVNGMEISSEASSNLKGLLDSARWKFEDILVHAWIRGMPQALCSTPKITHSPSRCEYLLPSGDMDGLNNRAVLNRIPLPNSCLPTAHHNLRFQNCRRS